MLTGALSIYIWSYFYDPCFQTLSTHMHTRTQETDVVYVPLKQWLLEVGRRFGADTRELCLLHSSALLGMCCAWFSNLRLSGSHQSERGDYFIYDLAKYSQNSLYVSCSSCSGSGESSWKEMCMWVSESMKCCCCCCCSWWAPSPRCCHGFVGVTKKVVFQWLFFLFDILQLRLGLLGFGQTSLIWWLHGWQFEGAVKRLHISEDLTPGKRGDELWKHSACVFLIRRHGIR